MTPKLRLDTPEPIPNADGRWVKLVGTWPDGREIAYPIAWSKRDGEQQTGMQGIELGVCLIANAIEAFYDHYDNSGTVVAPAPVVG